MPNSSQGQRCQVLLVADNLRWAFGHLCEGIRRYAPPEYNVLVTDQIGFRAMTQHKKDSLLHWADAITQTSWYEATFPTKKNRLQFRRNVGIVGSHGIEFSYPPPANAPWQAKIVTPQRNREYAAQRLTKFDRVLCCNRRLAGIATELGANAAYCEPGVDHELFSPGECEPHKKLRVGWCGQAGGLTKGYPEVLVPLQERLGDTVDWWVNLKSPSDATAHQLLPLWFREIDVFLSTSFSEGSQNPPLEAMACGKPTICTRTGTAEVVTKEGETGFLIDCYGNPEEAQRTVEQIVERIEQMQDLDLCHRMGVAARQRVEERFTWKLQSPRWLAAIVGQGGDS